MAITQFKVIQGYQFWYQWKAYNNATLYVWIIVTYVLWSIIVDYWSNFGCLNSNRWGGGEPPKFSTAKFGLKKLETSAVVWCKAYFDIMKHLDVTVWLTTVTDRQTDKLCHSICRASIRWKFDCTTGSTSHSGFSPNNACGRVRDRCSLVPCGNANERDSGSFRVILHSQKWNRRYWKAV